MMKPKLLKSKGHRPGLKLVYHRDHHNQHHRLLVENEEGEEEDFGENVAVFPGRSFAAAAAVSNSWGIRPLIAVPFKWELEPGVPKKQNPKNPMEPRTQAAAAERDPQQKANNKSAGVGVQSLAPPPRLMIPSNSSTTGNNRSGRDQHQQHKSLDHQHRPAHLPKSPMALNSPRSPRSISLSKKMKSLLQGKLKRSPSSSSSSSSFPSSPAAFSPKVHDDSSASSPCSPFWVADFDKDGAVAKDADQEQEEHDVESCTSVSRCSSSESDIVFDFSSFPTAALKPPHPDHHHRGPRVQQFQQHQQFQHQSSRISPFKNMSSMLLELWYGGDTGSNPALALPDSGFNIISPTASSSSSSDLESPGSSIDNSMSSFSSDSSESINPVPRRDHQMKTSFDDDEQYGGHFVAEPETTVAQALSCKSNLAPRYENIDKKLDSLHKKQHHDDYQEDGDSCKQDEVNGETPEEDFSLDFDDDLLADRFCFMSDRFRVESSESAALVSSTKQIEMRDDSNSSSHQQHHQKKHLPSALKKKDRNVNSALKKVRFAVVEDVHKFEQDEQDEEPEQEIKAIKAISTEVVPPDSPNSIVLSRYSSRSVSRFNGEGDEFTPSPRIKRDLSQVLLRIVQTDAELNRKQKGSIKLFSRW